MITVAAIAIVVIVRSDFPAQPNAPPPSSHGGALHLAHPDFRKTMPSVGRAHGAADFGDGLAPHGQSGQRRKPGFLGHCHQRPGGAGCHLEHRGI